VRENVNGNEGVESGWLEGRVKTDRLLCCILGYRTHRGKRYIVGVRIAIIMRCEYGEYTILKEVIRYTS